jgi:hypothetical protein
MIINPFVHVIASSGVAFRGVDHASFTSAAPTVNKPSGVVDGDLMLMWVVTTTNHTIANTPTGWTLIGTQSGTSDQSTSVFWRVASGEGASYTFNSPGNLLSASDTGKIAIIAYSGVDNASPINQSAANSESLTSTPTPPSITPSVDNCMIVHLLGQDPPGGGSSLSPDTSPVATERIEEYNGAAAGVYAQDYLQGSAAEIALNATCSTSDSFDNFNIALKPA